MDAIKRDENKAIAESASIEFNIKGSELQPHFPLKEFREVLSILEVVE